LTPHKLAHFTDGEVALAGIGGRLSLVALLSMGLLVQGLQFLAGVEVTTRRAVMGISSPSWVRPGRCGCPKLKIADPDSFDALAAFEGQADLSKKVSTMSFASRLVQTDLLKKACPQARLFVSVFCSLEGAKSPSIFIT